MYVSWVHVTPRDCLYTGLCSSSGWRLPFPLLNKTECHSAINRELCILWITSTLPLIGWDCNVIQPPWPIRGRFVSSNPYFVATLEFNKGLEFTLKKKWTEIIAYINFNSHWLPSLTHTHTLKLSLCLLLVLTL